MKLHGESLTMPEPDDAQQDTGGGSAWVVGLFLVIVAIAAVVAMAG